MLLFKNSSVNYVNVVLCIEYIIGDFLHGLGTYVHDDVGEVDDEVSRIVLSRPIVNTEIWNVRHLRFSSDFFVLLTDDAAAGAAFFLELSKSFRFKAYMKFFIVYLAIERVDVVFEALSRVYVENVLLVDAKGDLYTSLSYDERCGGPGGKSYVGSCRSPRGDEVRHVFGRKTLDFRGCKVRAHALVKPPFVVDVHSSDRPGIEPEVLTVAAELLNFTVAYVPHDFKFWGLKLTDGSYTEMVGSLYRGDVDLVFGNFRTNGSFLQDFSVSIPYVRTKISIFVPAAQKLSNWNSIVFVFAPIVWLLVCLATVAIVATTIFVSKILPNNEGYTSLVFATLQFYGVLLGKSVRQPEAPFLRTVFMVWTVVSFVLSSSYENTFLSFLVKPLYDQQINTVEEILASDLQVGGSRYTKKLFANVSSPKFTTEWVDCRAGLSCIERTSSRRDLVTIENEFFVRYHLRSFLDRRGRSKFHICDEGIVYYSWVLLRKGFPLQKLLNKLIEALRENGLIAKWTDAYLRQVYVDDQLCRSPLLIDNLLLIFYIYCGGHFVAFLAFLREWYCYA